MEWLLAAFGAISGVAVVVKAVALFPPVKSYFSDRREYKECGDKERDILKAVLTSRTGFIRPEGGINQFIRLIPHLNIREGYLAVSRSWYMPALEYLVGERYLIEEDSEEGSIYILTSSGKRFVERFAKKLCSHKFTGPFEDGVHQAKVDTLSIQVITGTVHTTIGGKPLGKTEAYPAGYWDVLCISPEKQNDGVVAKAYIIAEDLPVTKGDPVVIKFEDAPYHIHTYLTPRWAGNRLLGEGEKQVPTAAFTVKDIQPSGNGFQILNLSQECYETGEN